MYLTETQYLINIVKCFEILIEGIIPVCIMTNSVKVMPMVLLKQNAEGISTEFLI